MEKVSTVYNRMEDGLRQRHFENALQLSKPLQPVENGPWREKVREMLKDQKVRVSKAFNLLQAQWSQVWELGVSTRKPLHCPKAFSNAHESWSVLKVQRNEDKSTTLKLADFGLAKHVVRPIFTVCGTPTYVAPEILSEKGYGLEVDMWAAGVILYILLCGFPPFRSPERDQDELFNIIQLGHFEFLPPYWDNISDAAKDLVSRLLVVDPKKRYTAHQVLQHPWIETAGKTNTVKRQKQVSPSGEGHFRSQHKRVAEQVS
ncbi:Serine/threonine-protein kinase dclk3 [Saguinus oedipus]|uniref:Serine/threonine-protein kinase dclk3 n=1 Tax=Saguinus oedipus TaxID=9490 RepID=A0ABQ9U045_SAGOE|nr:Serine/threonine-protein kinase dclk3 [Saguinus oedipus]